MLLQSEALLQIEGVRHGFTTRLGGVTPGPTGTWDFAEGNPGIDENRRRLALRLGVEPNALTRVRQVHGTHIVEAAQGSLPEADGALTDDPKLAVSVMTADCAPVLLASPDGRWVAAVHAGWRGAVQGIVAQAVQQFVDRGVLAHELTAAIGPCIGIDAFEVGPEVVEQAEQALGRPAPARAGRGDRKHLDLAELVRGLLLQVGLPDERIDLIGHCTHDEPALFYSYRRDGADKGRQVAAISPKGPTA